MLFAEGVGEWGCLWEVLDVEWLEMEGLLVREFGWRFWCFAVFAFAMVWRA